MPIIEKHPELDLIAEEIAERVAFEINQRTMIGKITEDTRFKIKYCPQYILEEVIKLLEAKV